MSLAPRAVVVHRQSELELLVAHHGTRGQAEFFLSSRGRSWDQLQQRHDAQDRALQLVASAIPSHWRTLAVERVDLPRTRFDPEDVVIAVGPDGLVANVAKYLSAQPVAGVDPEPGRNPGVLVRHSPGDVAAVLSRVEHGSSRVELRSMAEAVLDDGQQLRALNEIYAGDPGHQSARYRLVIGERRERQSSSGVLVGTGTGATGWCASLAGDRPGGPALPEGLSDGLAWFVREAWPSPWTGRTMTSGRIERGQQLELVAESDLVVFGDGLEPDRLQLTYGQRLVVRRSAQQLHLVVPSSMSERGKHYPAE